MFYLYCNGKTLQEIHALNKSVYSLGQVVEVAVRQKWNAQKHEYQDTIVIKNKARAIQVAAESVDFVSDLMAGIRKQYGEKVVRALQSGNFDDIKTKDISEVIKQLKELTDLLMRLTGQDRIKQVGGTVNVQHSVAQIPTAPPIKNEKGDLAGWASKERTKLLEARKSGREKDE
jgi:hypothetical protein